MTYKSSTLHDMIFNLLKLKVEESYRNDVKTITNCQPSNNEDVVIKAYLDSELVKVKGHITIREKTLTEFTVKCHKS